MLKHADNLVDCEEFQPVNQAYNSTFLPNRLSLGLVVALESYTTGQVPGMTRHVERVQLAESSGFSAIWLRDVPFNVPSFGDAGQLFDPFVYPGLLAATTERIAPGVASIVLPLLITGGSQLDPDWIARKREGWITYPRGIDAQAKIINDWRARVKQAGGPSRPVVQSLYVNLVGDPDAPPQPIHLGFRSGVNPLRAYLKSLERIEINHVALNLRFNQADIETTLKRLAEQLLPDFTD